MKLIKFVAFLVAMSISTLAYAAYGKVTENSDVDPTIVKIKEADFLGVKIDKDYQLIDQNGQEFSFGELFGTKPTILALSYYRCDGACSVLNRNLWNTLQETKQWEIGKDFNVVTISFDPHDTPVTLKKFMKVAGFGDGLPNGWRMTTMKNPEDIMKLTGSMGYKFFWSPRDAIFLHPNVYIMLSPKGRVTRYLYGANISGQDMDISLTKAIGEKISPANVINFLVGSCYSYNYKDGKYKINYPLFVAAGALVFGLTLMFGGFAVTKRKRDRANAARDLRRNLDADESAHNES
ncbi:MAG TPA: SCO family protein [Mariprofundaceae bacterium]|nr:SCO family protein [Mariprofundaceae bacterium]